MAEYIEREALERSLNERLNRLFKLHGRHDHYVQGFDDCVGRVEEFPAADVVQVRHEKWGVNVGMNFFKERNCPVCKKRIESNFWNYCPNCGTDMRGSNDE